MEKLARIYDIEILPVWSHRFGRMLLRDLEIAPGAQILDIACGTGYPAVEIVRRMPAGARLIAIDGSSALLDVARKKIGELGAKGVFFRTEGNKERLSFADDVYDLVVCNLGLSELERPERALRELARVTRPGGQVRCTLPLAGTFGEFYDIYREVLVKHDKHAMLAALDEHIEHSYVTPERCEEWMAAAGLGEGALDVERFTMLFKSSREFFFAPVIEYGPLAAWKKIAGSGQEMQDVFWYIKEAIDAYFGGRAFEITVVAGCLRGAVQEPPDLSDEAETADTGEELAATVEGVSPVSEDLPPTVEGASPVVASAAVITPSLIDDDVPIEAFLEGAERPEHLDDAAPSPEPDEDER